MKSKFCCGLLITFILFNLIGCSNKRPLQVDSLQPIKDKITTEIFHTKNIGDYKITLYQPIQKPPVTGWPVIYLLDGDSFFSSAVAIVKDQRQQAIVVAIDYPEKSRRDLDYLPKPPELNLEILSNGKINIPQAYGGADKFLAFLQNELQPNLTQRFAINQNQQLVFGHSLGGLWVLHTLFTAPATFNYYVASSPSIWFSDRYILQEAQQFIQQKSKSKLAKPIDLSISVGEFEQTLTGKEVFSSAKEQQLRLQHLRNRRMVDNSQELAELFANANLDWLNLHYHIYAGQTHQTVADKVLDEQIIQFLQLLAK